MGNVSSRPGEDGAIALIDQARFSISGVTITNSRNRTLLNITPNAYPTSRYVAKRDIGDDTPVDYILDPESGTAGLPPSFLLKLSSDDELRFTFTFIIRRPDATSPTFPHQSSPAPLTDAGGSTNIAGLTFAYASSAKELDNLVTREFQHDPNLHKNPNVDLVGDYSTGSNPSVQFSWTWKWKPPKAVEDRGGGWRNTCSFVEYDQRAHKLNTLATFTFWVQNTLRVRSPTSPSPVMELRVPPKPRMPSAQSTQSIESRISDSDVETKDVREPQSPPIEPIPEYNLAQIPTNSTATTLVQRPGDDLSAVDDGPLFRASMQAMERKTGDMRVRWKKVLKRAEEAMEAQTVSNDAMRSLMVALREASASNANAVQPAIDHYFDNIAKEILAYEQQNSRNIRALIFDPITKLYTFDIKQAESKKREFEEESKEYYAYVGRYLGQRQDSLKEKKRAATDNKYQSKRLGFELKRFDYSAFMQDLHGGRKDQEVLSQLTRYADAQTKGYLNTARKIEALLPQLEALRTEVKEADKEYQLQRTEREEKRRMLEKSKKECSDPDALASTTNVSTIGQGGGLMNGGALGAARSMSNFSVQRNSVGSTLAPNSNGGMGAPSPSSALSSSPGNKSVVPGGVVGSPAQNRFKGYRDLEEKDHASAAGLDPNSLEHRKEGLLWALSKPGSHLDPKGLNKQAWHKFWVVLERGKLSEFTNWKQSLDLHNAPIDLRVASVREARNAERRFCFEVITPQYTRTYQATGAEDMQAWISAINNALQHAVEGKHLADRVSTDSLPASTRRDIQSVLSGKSTSLSGHRNVSNTKAPSRHATVGDRPSTTARNSEDNPNRLLQKIRDADAGNMYCADCNSDSKVEWVSINLGIVLCIECSGIHRSLGTHISKVRSLTLDTGSFTPDVVEMLLTVGNRVSNMIWESRLDRYLKPQPHSTREQRLQFITHKYADKNYVQPISSTLSHYSNPDETLLASIKKNDIQNVIYAMALGANLNAHDRSRNTHAVFLALAAADPASPSAAASPAASPGQRPVSSHSAPPAARKPFPIAELLLQNGADLPPQPAPIPLTTAAKLYLEQKADQRAGKKIQNHHNSVMNPYGSSSTNLAAPSNIGSGVGSAPGSSAGPPRGSIVGFGVDPTRAAEQDQDTITALPTIVAGNGTTPAEREKAREREGKLKKQGGPDRGRLIRSVGPGIQ